MSLSPILYAFTRERRKKHLRSVLDLDWIGNESPSFDSDAWKDLHLNSPSELLRRRAVAVQNLNGSDQVGRNGLGYSERDSTVRKQVTAFIWLWCDVHRADAAQAVAVHQIQWDH